MTTLSQYHRKKANKRRKEIETDFQNGMLQIKAITQKSGSWLISFSIGSSGKATTWVKYFIVVTLFGFSQSRDREVKKSEKADKVHEINFLATV